MNPFCFCCSGPPPPLLGSSSPESVAAAVVDVGTRRRRRLRRNCRRRQTLLSLSLESGHCYCLRSLPGCHRTGSETAAVSVQPFFLSFSRDLMIACRISVAVTTVPFLSFQN
ncbi:uncharacterized protein DS421_18g622830 [Arachis hypogaea]|nr:uncharacterized protein DS421_18g622830 [Arachis hypogaea]